MALTSSQSFRNNSTKICALKKLLDGDLELRSFIIRRQEEAQAQCTYAKEAVDIFADCLTTTSAVKDAYAASLLSTKALKEALKRALRLCDDHPDILATISSTKGILAAWNEIVTLTETLHKHLDKTTTQVETHLHLAADEHAAHQSAHIGASESLLSCTDSLRAVDQSIAQKRGVLFPGLSLLPTEILLRIFMEAVDAKQHDIFISLSSYYVHGYTPCDIDPLLTTLNLVPFTLSATCKRWRAICQSTPRLWRYAPVPTILSSQSGQKIIGKTQFEQCVRLAQKQPLELTIYPCVDTDQQGLTYPKFVLPKKYQKLRVNLVWHHNCTIPRGLPSPNELCFVASADFCATYPQALPTEWLANTKVLRCIELGVEFGGYEEVNIQSLHISLSSCGVKLPRFNDLLQKCPQLKELHADINLDPWYLRPRSITHEQLHTLSLTGLALEWAIEAFSIGCRLPRLTRLVLTDINGFTSSWETSLTCDQFSHLTHIEIRAASEPDVVAQFGPLFDITPVLRTLTLAGSAVEPVLKLLTSPTPKGVQGLIICDSDADGTALQDYLAELQCSDGGAVGMKLAWKNCPRFSGEYGSAEGGLYL